MENDGGTRYELIEGVTWADCAFRAYGETLPALFINAAHALLSIIMEDITQLRPVQKMQFTVQKETLELLLYAYLEEFLFYKDSQSVLLLPDVVIIGQGPAEVMLECHAVGETIDQHRHRLLTDVKAITMHRLTVTRENEQWNALVVVDV